MYICTYIYMFIYTHIFRGARRGPLRAGDQRHINGVVSKW